MSTIPDDDLKPLIGKESPPLTGPDKVSKQMIRHWCEAVEDTNPLYTDEEYAKKSRYGSIISPPAMVQTWSYGPVWPDGQEMRYRHPERLPQQEQFDPVEEAFNKLGEAGFLGAVDIDTTLEFIRPLFQGDRVSVRSKLLNVTEKKKTRLGNGYFMTFAFSYSNQKGEPVCNQTMTIFRFKMAGL
jgi:acyl dehydratase